MDFAEKVKEARRQLGSQEILSKEIGVSFGTVNRWESGTDLFFNMENINAVFIKDSIPQAERLQKLNQIAISQMKVLNETSGRIWVKQHGTKYE